MARPLQFNDFEINKFTGLDLRGPTESLPEKTLSKCVNFEIGLLGELKKRPGIVRQALNIGGVGATGGVKFIGNMANDVFHHLIVQTDNVNGAGRLYKSLDSGVNWTQLSTPAATDYNCGKGVQYANATHMISMSGLLVWDGSTFTVYADAQIPRSNYRPAILQERLFVLESSTRNIKFSNVGDFAAWPSTNYISFPVEAKDRLIGIIPYRDRLVLLRNNSLSVIYLNGPPSSWNVKQLPFNVGVPNEDSAVVYNDLLYLLSYDGVYRTDLTQVEEISKPISPIFARRRKMNFQTSTVYSDCIAYYNGRIVCSIFTDVGLFRMMVFNIDNNTWTEWLPFGLYINVDGYPYNPPRDMFSLHTGRRINSGSAYQKEGIYFSFYDNTGQIWLFDDQNPIYADTAGFSFTSTARTKATNVDLPHQWKRCARFSVRAHKTSGTNMTGLYNVNGVDGPTFNVPITSTPVQTRLKGPGWFRELAFEVSDNSSNYLEIQDYVVSIKKKSEISESAT